MTLSSVNLAGYAVKDGVEPDMEKLEEIKRKIEIQHYNVILEDMMQDEVKAEQQPIRRTLDTIEKDLVYSSELEKTLRDRLSPVLSQQPKIEKAITDNEKAAASSTVYSDLESINRQIERLNAGLLEILEDLEI